MSAPNELAVALAQLETEGGADLAQAYRYLVEVGALGAEQALEAIAMAETLATAKMNGDVTDEQAGVLVQQLATEHASGRKG